ALPAADASRPELGQPFVAPRTPTEETLAGIWREVLGIDRVGIHDGFFELGGHSLLATQVAAQVRERLGVELPLREVFEEPTIASLAARVETARESAPPLAPIPPAPRDEPLPLSFAQERLWFLDQLEPGSAFYNIPGAIRWRGPINIATLE